MATIDESYKKLVLVVKKILSNEEDDSLYVWALHTHVLDVVGKHLPRKLLSLLHSKKPTIWENVDGVYECSQSWCKHSIFGSVEPVKRCEFKDCDFTICNRCHNMFLSASNSHWKCRIHSSASAIQHRPCTYSDSTSSSRSRKAFLILLDIDECILKLESRMKSEQFPIRPADLVFERIEKDGSKRQIRAWWRRNLEYFLTGLEDIGGIALRIFSASDFLQVELVVKQLKIAFPLDIVRRMPDGKFSSRAFHPDNVDMKAVVSYKNLSLLFEKESSLSSFIDAYRCDAAFLVVDDCPEVYMKTSENFHEHVIGIEKFHGESPVKHIETSALKEVLHVIREVIMRYRSQLDDESTRFSWPVRALLRIVLDERDDSIEESKNELDVRIRSIQYPKKASSQDILQSKKCKLE